MRTVRRTVWRYEIEQPGIFAEGTTERNTHGLVARMRSSGERSRHPPTVTNPAYVRRISHSRCEHSRPLVQVSRLSSLGAVRISAVLLHVQRQSDAAIEQTHESFGAGNRLGGEISAEIREPIKQASRHRDPGAAVHCWPSASKVSSPSST